MKQYVITAYDYTDGGALERRMNVRPHHFESARKLKNNGNFIFGGAILNDDGKMTGSIMVMQFETEEQLENWKQNEPYITQKIWETYDIKPFKLADV
ncbi:YciI-like protein [mine drainage metagenome]|uniref:YciI-like protein n=1 Tax=mine drainage metagenome TaxID=410659 RepID=A0A1J5PFV3_9ZZZZ